MNRRARMQNTSAVRRIKGTVTRLEQQPYDYVPRTRPPRLGGASGHGWCQLSSSLGPATGTWPSLTPTTASGITIYRKSGNSLAAIPGTFTLYNWRNVTWSANKTMLVLPNGDGTWDIIDQDC